VRCRSSSTTRCGSACCIPRCTTSTAIVTALFGRELPTWARAWAAHPDDIAIGELVEELTSHSTEFARLWAKRCVRVNGRGLTPLLHPRVGPLTVEYEVLTPLQDPDQRVIIRRAADTASQAAMDAIAREAERPRPAKLPWPYVPRHGNALHRVGRFYDRFN
jgi:hypothetical protein